MRGKSKWSIVVALLLVMSMFLAACSGGGSNKQQSSGSKDKSGSTGGNTSGTQLAKDQVFNLTSTSTIPTLDWTKATDTASTDAISNIQSGLTRMHNDKVEYDLAAGPPKVNSDKTVYTFTIRDNAKWSDGTPVTAQDFVWAWRHENDPKTGALYNFVFASANIKNAAAIQNKKSPLYGKVDQLGVKAIDSKHLQVTLSQPTPFFVSILSFAPFYPEKQSFVEKQGKKYALAADKVLYSGPFVISKDWTPSSTKWTYSVNPNYWNKDNIKIQKVNINVVKDMNARVNLYKTGSVDEVPLDGQFIDQFKSSDKSEFHTGLTSTTRFLYLGMGHNKALQNINLRKALSAAINKQDFVNLVIKDGSIASNYLVPKKFTFDQNGKDFRAYAPNGFPAGSKSDAQKYWDQAKKDLGISKLNLTLISQDGSTVKTWDQYIANQISSTLKGITVNINQQPWGQYLKLQNAGNYDIAFSGWAPDYRDPMTYLDMWTSDNSQNTTGWKDSTFDNLIKQAKASGAEPAKRWKLMQQAEKYLLTKGYPMIPLIQGGHAWVQKPYVKGLSYPLYGQTIDFTGVSILKHK